MTIALEKREEFIDKEAEESGELASSEENYDEAFENEENEKQSYYEQNEFEIKKDDVDELLSFSGDENEQPRERKRLKSAKKRWNRKLDQEDLELLRENARYTDDDHHAKRPRVSTEEELDRQLFGDHEELDVAEGVNADEVVSENEEAFCSDSDDFVANEYRSKRRANDKLWDKADLIQGRDAIETFDYSEYFESLYEDKGDEELVLDRKNDVASGVGLEPILVEENFFKPEYEAIVSNDIPERQQEMLSRGPITDEQIMYRVNYIYNELFGVGSLADGDKEQILKRIEAVLKLVFQKHYELPFVIMYRPEVWKSADEAKGTDLTVQHLWRFMELDYQFSFFQEFKANFLAKLRRAREEDDPLDVSELERIESEVELLLDMESLNDWRLYYSLMNSGRRRDRSGRFSLYWDALNGGLQGFVDRWNVDCGKISGVIERIYRSRDWSHLNGDEVVVSEFSKRLESDILQLVDTFPFGDDEMPEAMARSLECSFSSAESILYAVRNVIATRIVHHPVILRHLRRCYLDVVTLSTNPTALGKRVIDAFHLCRPVRRLCRKPFRLFEADHYLRILYGIKFKLIELKVDDPFGRGSMIYGLLSACFWNPCMIPAWLEQKDLLVQLVFTLVSNSFQNYLFYLLKSSADEYVSSRCASQLEKLLMSGPFRLEEREKNQSVDIGKPREKDYYDSENAEAGSTSSMVVLSVFSDTNTTEMVVLDGHGEYMDMLKLPSNLSMCTHYHELRSELLRFICMHRPMVVVVGANSNLSIQNCNYLRMQFDYLAKNHSYPSVRVFYMDTNVARLYGASRLSREYGELSACALIAVSLGRRLLDPMLEMVRYWNSQPGLMDLHLHPLQKLVNPHVLKRKLLFCLLQTVNSVGVDLNRLILHPWMHGQLEFVAGLGRYKASNLLKKLVGLGQVESRRQLLDEGYLGPVVWTNACGFLKVCCRESGDNNESSYLNDSLDVTRIHPNHEPLAMKIARDAVGIKGDDVDYIGSVLDDPELLKKFDVSKLDEMARKLVDDEGRSRRLTIMAIYAEFFNPFMDCREPFRPITPGQLFDIITGEKLVRGSVHGVKITKYIHPRLGEPPELNGYLECGIPARIFKLPQSLMQKQPRIEDLLNSGAYESDSREMRSNINIVLRRKISEFWVDRMLMCRVTAVHKDNEDQFLVEMTADEDDLISIYLDPPKLQDPYWIEMPEDLHPLPSVKPVEKRMQFAPRKCTNPFFQNITLVEAESQLKDQPVGSYLIVPHGTNGLAVVMKFYLNSFLKLFVAELYKSEATELGKALQIDDMVYSCLDELIVAHIDPIWMNAKDIGNFSHWSELKESQVETNLRTQKQLNPSHIPYTISPSTKNPGYLLLSFLPGRNTVKHEYISIKPNGYKLRKIVFSTIQELITWFKKNNVQKPVSQQKNPQNYIPVNDYHHHHHHRTGIVPTPPPSPSLTPTPQQQQQQPPPPPPQPRNYTNYHHHHHHHPPQWAPNYPPPPPSYTYHRH